MNKFITNGSDEFLALQAYYWNKKAGSQAKALPSEILRVLVQYKGFSPRFTQADFLGEDTLTSRSEQENILALNANEKSIILGWIYCREFPYAKLTLDIVIGDEFKYQISVDKPNKELKELGIGNADHAFNFEFDGKKAIDVDVFFIKVSGSGYVLPESKTTH